ncbi:hypothetical protein [Amycolatopsis albispora]|uniref:hypothetical protein n=1 Tax=Amycolatopsis albispora TaxID=1804986 RepID=UPI001964654B|nr:hypothetical protein [Amycolatopsis albispora]
MKKLVSRVLVTGVAVAAFSGAAGGVASAADSTPIWVLPGVDLGSVLDPTIGIPGGLAPVFDLLKLIGA